MWRRQDGHFDHAGAPPVKMQKVAAWSHTVASPSNAAPSSSSACFTSSGDHPAHTAAVT